MGKYMHCCPHCGAIAGFKGGGNIPELECASCEEPVTWIEWKNAPRVLKPEYQSSRESTPKVNNNVK